MNRFRRQPRQILLDGIFAVMLLHFFVTGNIVPQPLIDLFHDQPQIVVSIEPELVPDAAPNELPLTEDGDLRPETHSTSRAHGAA